MYKQYLNDYEKRAEQIRKAAQSIEKTTSGASTGLNRSRDYTELNKQCTTVEGLSTLLKRFSSDDILLIILLFLLMNSEEKDMTLIVILGYLLLSGF